MSFQTNISISWSIDFTWNTNEYFEKGSFQIISPSGTTVIIASGIQGGTYSLSSKKFNTTSKKEYGAFGFKTFMKRAMLMAAIKR